MKEQGPEEFSIATFLLWHLVKNTLLSDNVKVKEQLENLAKTFEEIQDEESMKSIKNFEDEEVKSSKRDIEEEEETLESEIVLFKKTLEEERKEGSRNVSIRPQRQSPFLVASNPFAAASAPIDIETEI